MALIHIRKTDRDTASDLGEKLDLASRALHKRSAPLGRRKDKIDQELARLRDDSSDSFVSVFKAV